MIYVTSDLHGWPLADFLKLLEKARFGSEDFLYILGDVIDRGDGGVELLRWIMNQPNAELLLGNHEAMLLSCAFLFDEITDESLAALEQDQMRTLMNWMMNGAEPTLDALRALRRTDPDALHDLLDFLRDAPLYDAVSTERGDFLLVHAGLGNFYHGKRLSEYTPDELLWHRPAIAESYFDDITTVLGHTPARHYGAPPGRAYHARTWIDIDSGAADGGAPMLLRLDDLAEFYAE